MALFTQTQTNGSVAGDRIRRFRDFIVTRIQQNREFRRTYEELNSLSDRDLADLGMIRSDIGRIARETVYGAAAL